MHSDSAGSIQRWLSRTIGPEEPGAIVAVYHGGTLDTVVARGLACLEYTQPITTASVFNIGSCTKQLTATVALMLHADGVLDLDAPIGEHLPELPVGDRVTVRQCLQHTAGLYDYLSVGDIAGLAVGALATERQFLSFLERQRVTEFPPGRGISYSNTNFVAAALALQRAAGEPFAHLVADRIFAPLGMRASSVRDRVGVVVKDMAFSYERDADAFRREEMPDALPGDSNVLTTVADLAPWFGFLAHGRPFGEALLGELVTPARLGDGSTTAYAHGLFTGRAGATAVIGHSGSHYGYRALILSIPERDFGLAVLGNRGDLPVGELVNDLVAEASTPARHSDARPPVDAPVIGDWYAPDANEVLQVRAEQTGLRVTDTEGSRVLYPAGGESWASWDGLPRLEATGSDLVAINRIGRRSVCHRLVADMEPGQPLAGTYVDRESGVRIEITGTAEALALVREGLAPLALQYAGHIGETYVYRTGWWVLGFSVGGATPAALALRCENASVPSFTRVEDRVAGPTTATRS